MAAFSIRNSVCPSGRRLLKAALQDFNGTVICVSHDRDFLDGLVSKVYEFGGGHVREHLGGIYDFLQAKRLNSLQDLERKTQTTKTTENTEATPPASAGQAAYAAQKAEAAARRKKEKQIADTEAAIARLEAEQKTLEETMAADPAKQTPENFQRYEHIKREVEQKLYEWEILSE